MNQVQTEYNSEGFVKRLASGNCVVKAVRRRTEEEDNGLYVTKKTYSNCDISKENVLFGALATNRIKLQNLNTEDNIDAFMFSCLND